MARGLKLTSGLAHRDIARERSFLLTSPPADAGKLLKLSIAEFPYAEEDEEAQHGYDRNQKDMRTIQEEHAQQRADSRSAIENEYHLTLGQPQFQQLVMDVFTV